MVVEVNCSGGGRSLGSHLVLVMFEVDGDGRRLPKRVKVMWSGSFFGSDVC
jgi:hypothetical protein